MSDFKATTFILVKESGAQVKPGQALRDFRGEIHYFRCITKEPMLNSTGKIMTSKGEFYPSVFDCKLIEKE